MATQSTSSAGMTEDPGAFGSGFVEVDINDVKDFVTRNGVAGIEKKLQSKLDEWKNIPLNVAITGNSGTGKSSFINAVRGLTADDEGGAAVDVVEATAVPTPYRHPLNNNLQFWDLPGVGTQRFPKHTYLRDINFEKYDFFLVFLGNRFTENDLWLAKEVQKNGRKLFFIRAKIDADIDSNKRAHPRAHNEDEVIWKIRQNCQENLQRAHFEKVDLFIISNYDTTKWDFPTLTTRMIADLPDRKREAMTLSIGNFTKEILRNKREILGKRIKFVALASGVAGALPVPGLSFGVDMGLLLGEAKFYREQLGLDDRSLEAIAESAGTTKEMIQKLAGIPNLARFTAQEMAKLLAKQAASEAVEDIAKFALPVIGSLISGTISFTVTSVTLYKLLNDMERDALKVLEVAIRRSTSV